ncbi:MAG: UvrD-helicase domain-containing protein [Endomicrobiales bacterium]|nr:UvrD-helicase domain-containing protein [Endomicrobiales bacterium]
MRFIADMHIHSHYSIATSKKLTPEHLDYWAQLKGIDVVGTGDCVHPGWLSELKEKLEPKGNGLFQLKEEYKLKEPHFYLPKKTRKDVSFMLTGEISSIYKKRDRVRKIHNLCVFPDFESAEKIQNKLSRMGNIKSDGRPILGIDAKDILEMTLETSQLSYLIPAHIWTPWFSLLGAKSGFNSIEECFEDLSEHIFAVETGLSSDPPMNWACSFLDNVRLVSNSDAHSPEKLGREANIFDAELSYKGIHDALKYDKGFLGTIEFFPQEGKYHYDGHRKCGICWDPVETIKNEEICPVCKKPITKGVMYRIAELADRSRIGEAKNKKDFYSITSLPSLVAEMENVEPTSKKVNQAYFKILENVGSDFDTLLFKDLSEIKKQGGDLLVEGVKRMRNRNINIQEGFDGEFGRITVFDKDEVKGFGLDSLFFQVKEREKKYSDNQPKYSIKFDIDTFKKAYKEKTATGADSSARTKADSRHSKEEGSQFKAITHKNGACLVTAGPGSGKTHVLTERIAYLIKEKSIPQENILAITFSNKAAEEMRSRVKEKIADFTVNILTFHAFGLSVLKRYPKHFGRNKGFKITDEDERGDILKDKKTLKLISSYKQGVLAKDKIDESDINEYEETLKKQNSFDLDDLIFLPVKLFKEDKEILEDYKKQYRHILVDEFQDVNPVQFELLRLLAPDDTSNLFVIGDPDQAIYGFRGSDVKFIKEFQKNYSKAVVIYLSKSYRCPSPVLKIAGQVLDKKDVLKGKSSNIKISIRECETDKSEADLVASQIEKMIGGTRSFSIDSGMSDGDETESIKSFSDFAVLCRSSLMFGPITASLEKHGIPYQVIGAEPFYRQEPFKGLLARLKGNYAKGKKNISDVLYDLIKDEEDISDIDKKRFVEMGNGFNNDYESFFRAIAMRDPIDEFSTKKEAVSVMTMHASKGLEFNAVFVCGCEQGIIPFEVFGKRTEDELEEEERLFYVAATRTKNFLFLSYAKKRVFKNRLLMQKKSSFLNRLEKNLIDAKARTSKRRDQQLDFSLFK